MEVVPTLDHFGKFVNNDNELLDPVHEVSEANEIKKDILENINDNHNNDFVKGIMHIKMEKSRSKDPVRKHEASQLTTKEYD